MAQYEDWLSSLGIDKGTYGKYTPEEQIGLTQSFTSLQSPGTSEFDFTKMLGSDAFKGGLAAFGLGKDLVGGYMSWKNAQDMKDIMNRELGMKEDMWNEQKAQIAQFNADKKKLNQGYSGLASTAV